MIIPIDLIELPYLLALAIVLPVFFVWLLRRNRVQRQRRLARLGALDVVRRLVPAVAFSGGKWRAARIALAWRSPVRAGAMSARRCAPRASISCSPWTRRSP